MIDDNVVCLWKKYAEKMNIRGDSLPMADLYNCLECYGLPGVGCPNYLSNGGKEMIRYDLINGDYR